MHKKVHSTFSPVLYNKNYRSYSVATVTVKVLNSYIKIGSQR